MKQLTVNADVQNLSKVLEFIIGNLHKDSKNEKLQHDIELVCEEIFVNICNYAYGDKTGMAKIETDISDGKLTIIFRDNGIPFNPLTRQNPDISLPPEERSIGGLGIYLVKNLANEVSYRYDENTNILMVIKKIGNI
ncbi:MAG: ATP-binding protein [Clostridia bacterium]|nr:ATP-binding protein [Clostridia bacterium]